MANPIRKFLFDNRFDLPPEPEPEIVATNEEGESEPPPPPPPTFSEDDMAVAREEAFAQGHEQGTAEALAGAETRTAEALEALPGQFKEIFRRQAEAQDILVANGVQVAMAVMRKLFPAFARRGGADEIVKVVEDSVRRLIEESRVVLRVHPDLAEAVTARIAPTTARIGAESKVVVLGDAEIAFGDCRMEWDGGGAERDSARLWREIDAVIERNLTAQAEGVSPGIGET